MKMQLSIIGVGLALCLGCSSVNTPSTPTRTVLEKLKQEVPQLRFPLHLELNGVEKLPIHEFHYATDTLFPGGQILGWHTINDSVTAVYWIMSGGDYPIPTVQTFLNGAPDGRYPIGIGSCGSGGCGFSCKETCLIEASGEFESMAIIQQQPCDDQGVIAGAPIKIDTIVQEGIIIVDGGVEYLQRQ